MENSNTPSVIDLEKTVFDPSFLTTDGINLDWTFLTVNPETLEAKSFPDFGIVIFGWETLTDVRWKNWVLDWACSQNTPGTASPIFLVSHSAKWRMPNLLKALGVFASTSEARKNGWDKDVPSGFASHKVRLNKKQGVIHTFKISESMTLPGSWEASCDPRDDVKETA